LVRDLFAEDWPAVEAIYAAGIATGNATFETATPTWEAFDGTRLPSLRLVADAEGQVVGWAAVSAVSDRCVYAGVVEHSVYVAPSSQGRGVGRLLLTALIQQSEARGIWTIQSGIFPENAASLALHEGCGFRIIGTREQVGCHDGRWRDVVMVERRSKLVGV
jgi:phosphinothricin acetyltransferase